MIASNSIFIGVFDGFSWIRCEGKGSFMNSPLVKEFGDQRIANGERCLVVDLAGCIGMDSTFMGTLAGMAARLTGAGGVLQVAEPGTRNRHSLEDLGLDFLMEIEPASSLWGARIGEIRGQLEAWEAGSGKQSHLQRARHVLEAHQTLSDVSEKNAREFTGVVKTLENELIEKEKLVKEEEKS